MTILSILIFAKEKVVAPVKKTFIILIIAWLSFILPSYNSICRCFIPNQLRTRCLLVSLFQKLSYETSEFTLISIFPIFLIDNLVPRIIRLFGLVSFCTWLSDESFVFSFFQPGTTPSCLNMLNLNNPAGIYLFKANNRNNCELTDKK